MLRPMSLAVREWRAASDLAGERAGLAGRGEGAGVDGRDELGLGLAEDEEASRAEKWMDERARLLVTRFRVERMAPVGVCRLETLQGRGKGAKGRRGEGGRKSGRDCDSGPSGEQIRVLRRAHPIRPTIEGLTG